MIPVKPAPTVTIANSRSYFEKDVGVKFRPVHQIEFFTISPQHKIGNIANFVLAVPFKIKNTNEVYNLER